MALNYTVVLVDCLTTLNEGLADISPATGNPDSKLAIDLEGVDLCRHNLPNTRRQLQHHMVGRHHYPRPNGIRTR